MAAGFDPRAPLVISDPQRENRREPSTGAFACLGYAWDEVIPAMFERMTKDAPELKNRSFIWIVRARINGFRVEFYDDDEAFLKELEKRVAREALNPNGPQIHAGRISRL